MHASSVEAPDRSLHSKASDVEDQPTLLKDSMMVLAGSKERRRFSPPSTTLLLSWLNLSALLLVLLPLLVVAEDEGAPSLSFSCAGCEKEAELFMLLENLPHYVILLHS